MDFDAESERHIIRAPTVSVYTCTVHVQNVHVYKLQTFHTHRSVARAETLSPRPMPPERVLQKFDSRLYHAIQFPQSFARSMCSVKLIGHDVVHDLPSMTVNEGKSKLLSALRSAIRESDHKEVVMSRIFLALEKVGEPPLKAIASDMRAFCQGWPIVCKCLYFIKN